MSFLSVFESVVSYIGFMFGAPSISAPLDMPARATKPPSVEDLLFGDEFSECAQPPASMSDSAEPDSDSSWWLSSRKQASLPHIHMLDRDFLASSTKTPRFGVATDSD